MDSLLTVENLRVSFHIGKQELSVVQGVDFSIKKGETVCIVGESGCGKSVTALSIMRLHQQKGCVQTGSIRLSGTELTQLSETEMRAMRGNRIAMVFQDPLTSLNPLFTVGFQMREVLKLHLRLAGPEADRHSVELLRKVGIRDPWQILHTYPHMLSGGMRQRVMIAMALSCKPELLIADEPTTALDVTVQLQILQLLRSLQRELGMSVLLITHDLGVVAEMADRVVVLYAGQIVEEADVFSLFRSPLHPYTQNLIRLIPNLKEYQQQRVEPIQGHVPVFQADAQGCRFRNRCGCIDACCREGITPPLAQVAPGHRVRCWKYAESKGGLEFADGTVEAEQPRPSAQA